MVNLFDFFAHCARDLGFNHHEIQEFANNYHISAMKINKNI
jgi:hypothetical protein